MRLSLLVAAVSTVALMGSVEAQTAPAKPAAKPAAAKPAPAPAAAPVAAKPKIMTKEELRSCLDRSDANKTEAAAIEADDKLLADERAAVLAKRDDIKTKNQAIEAEAEALKAEMAAVAAKAEELKVKMKEMTKKEQLAAKADYDKLAAEINAKVDPHNQRRKAFLEEVKAFEADVDGFNKRKDELGARADALGEKQDAWRNECGNRPYKEDDEKAIRKEQAAAKKAP